MSEVIMQKDGERVETPDISLRVKAVEHNGVKLSVLVESVDGCTDRFERVNVITPSVEGYMDAAVDYMTEVIKLSMRLASEIWNKAAADHVRALTYKAKKDMKSEHINAHGEFKSDKYPWCLPGFVPLKLTDKMAQPVLSDYARRREAVDAQFSKDLCTCLTLAGYDEMRPAMSSVYVDGRFDKPFKSEQAGAVERNEHGARIIYREKFLRERVNLRFLDKKGDRVDPDAGDTVHSYQFLASVRGHNHISEHAIAYIELINDDVVVRLDYRYAHSFCFPRGMKLSDFPMVEVGYHNMELRGSPPPYSPGAVPPK